VGDSRECELCGTTFVPRREHARFCSADCRVTWNRENQSEPGTPDCALVWSITAMADVTSRLPRIAGLDRPRAFALISEAVWWVTLVDANLVRYHPDVYDRVLASRSDADQVQIEETLGGLRFVRNQMGNDDDRVDFILPAADGAGRGLAREWAWTPLPEPDGGSFSPRGLDWELARYRAYQSRLAGRPVDETFQCAATFLQAAADGVSWPAAVVASE
jgi:hypothetical protein